MHPREYTYKFSLEKTRKKRLAILPSQKNVPRAISMQICAAITECIFSYRLVNITDNGTINMFTLMF